MLSKKSHDNIMLVDDDPVVNFIHVQLISSMYDCKVEAYTEGKAALDYLINAPLANKDALPSVLLLDLNMPGMNGWTFLGEFEKLPVSSTKNCKVFIVSSSVDIDDQAKSKKFHSVQGFFSKPLTRDMLRDLIGESITGKHLM